MGLHDSGTSEGEPKAVFNALAWSKYTFKTNNFNTKKLLKDFSIKADKKNFNQLDNLIKLMIAQSKTCLQGNPLIVFRQLKIKLKDLKTKNEELNTRALWEHIIKRSGNTICHLKSAAFRDDGPYL